jgi:putative ABC transport system substrate-binding protein
MRRRDVILALGGAAAAVRPLAARAQQPRPVTIGILNQENPEPLRALLRDSLRDIGYVEGETLRVEFRSAEGSRDRLADLAAELIGLKVDVLVAYPTQAVVAARDATRELPIVMFGAGDPLATGLVANLARPGGNITGTSSTASESGSKTLEIVREIIPSVRRVAALANAPDPFTRTFVEQLQRGGSALRLEIEVLMINAAEELDAAFATMTKNAADAVVVQPSLPRRLVAELALKYRIPAIAPTLAFAALGGLASYAGSPKEAARRTAAIIDRILKGSKPADLPVEQPTIFELAINLKTAKALGLDIPPTLLARATCAGHRRPRCGRLSPAPRYGRPAFRN